jgi:hypothetical protein
MSNSIRTVYASGRFDVFDGERHLIHQPFKVNDTGAQDPWDNEEQALAWWDKQKGAYGIASSEATTEPATTENTEE